jgi:uncharacterized protein (AIM24 family)
MDDGTLNQAGLTRGDAAASVDEAVPCGEDLVMAVCGRGGVWYAPRPASIMASPRLLSAVPFAAGSVL